MKTVTELQAAINAINAQYVELLKDVSDIATLEAIRTFKDENGNFINGVNHVKTALKNRKAELIAEASKMGRDELAAIVKEGKATLTITKKGQHKEGELKEVTPEHNYSLIPAGKDKDGNKLFKFQYFNNDQTFTVSLDWVSIKLF